MIWPMVVVHKIDENSPFYRMSAAEIITERYEAGVMLSLQATFNFLSQSLYLYDLCAEQCEVI